MHIYLTILLYQRYLDTAIERVNLTILVNALVTEIDFHPISVQTELIASRVNFIHEGSMHSVQVNKEAIVCAG
jgi:hypothetical protein